MVDSHTITVKQNVWVQGMMHPEKMYYQGIMVAGWPFIGYLFCKKQCLLCCLHACNFSCNLCFQVFGAYCATDWETRHRKENKAGYFGTGETFIFRFHPKQERFPWVGIKLREKTDSTSSYFQAGTKTSLMIGGGYVAHTSVKNGSMEFFYWWCL